MLVLSEDQLRRQVPSVFSISPSENTSNKYAVIPTIDCIRGLIKSDFHPVKAQETRCRSEENKPFTKHMIRFRHASNMENIQQEGEISEIIMINSHDGKSSYQLRGGIYRLVCTNGLIVGEEAFLRAIRHQGDVVSKVVQAAHELTEIMPKVKNKVEEWKGISLDVTEQGIYAESASLLKWAKDEAPISNQHLLRPRRFADQRNDLWTTFNRVQENLIRGDIPYIKQDERGNRTRNRTRGVNSINENARINTALWNLTEKMAAMKV
jgi:hypothetical protein